MNINSTNSFSFCFHFSKRSSWPPILIATNERRNEAEDCSRVERERRDGSRFTFAYQRPWKDGFREKCVATLRNSSYKGETYFSPDVWKAFDLAFPSLSLSLPLFSKILPIQGTYLVVRERVYIEGNGQLAMPPILPVALLRATRFKRRSHLANRPLPRYTSEWKRWSDIKMARAIEKYDSFSLSLSLPRNSAFFHSNP